MSAVPTLLVSAPSLRGERIEICGAQYRHLFRARRLEVGETVRVTDGEGAARFGQITEIDRQRGLIELAGPAPGNEPEGELELAVATLRSERASWLVEKTTELGVVSISWFNADRSPRRYGEAQLDRLRRVAAAALEQCGRSWLPRLQVFSTWDDLLSRVASRQSLVLDPRAPERLVPAPTPERRLVVVGPEGGLTDQESSELLAAGAQVRSLGPQVLRAETAAMAASALLLAGAPGPSTNHR